MPSELSDANVFGTSAQAAILPKEMSDAEVFAPQKELSDADVFGGPGVLSRIGDYAKETAKQVAIGGAGYLGSAVQALAPKDEESRRLEAAIAAVQAGEEPGVAAMKPPVPALPLTQEPLYKAGEAISTGTEKFLQPTGILPPLAQDVARGVGSVGGALLSNLVPGGAITIPLSGMGEAAQTAVQKGATPEQSERAAQLGTIPGMTDFVDLLLPNLGGSTGKALGLIKRVGLRAIEGVFVEGGQEGLQQWLQNLITKGVYKPDQDVFEDVPRSALVGAIVGGGTAAVIGGHGEHAPVVPPSQGDITAAGTGITAPPGTPGTPLTPPTTPPVTPPPPTAGMQGELPLGPPTLQGPALGQRLAGIIEPIDSGTVEPSLNPLVQRGSSIVDASQSPVAASGPLETRPQNVEIPPEHIEAMEARNVHPDEKVAVPAIEYDGMLFPGAIHLEAVGNAMRKLGLSEDQIIDNPTFREGFVTTTGRFISREAAASIAARHDQYESGLDTVGGPRLFSEELKVMQEPGAYRKAFEAIDASQAARGLRNEVTPEEIIAKKKATPKPIGITTTTAEKKAYQLAKDLETAKKQGLPIPAITVGRQVGIPEIPKRKAFNIQSIHSTTVGELVPKLDFTHFEKDSISRAIAEALRNRLVAMIPTMPIHIARTEDVRRASGTGSADGIFFPSVQSLGLPIEKQGPILVSTNTFDVPGRFAEVVMHESVHGATSNVVHADPVMREKVTKLMEAAKVAWGKGWEKVYSFTNEREFLTGVFTKETFQEFLRQKPISTKLWNELGLNMIEEKPAHAKLWNGFLGVVQQIFRLPGKPKEVKSILEAAVLVGVDVMEAQAIKTQRMQAKFNKVEPSLIAVPQQEETQHAYSVLNGLRDHIEPGVPADEMARQVGYADKMNWFYKQTLHAFQLGELNPFLAPLQRILEKARFASVEEARINDAALRVMKDWVNLGRDMSGKLVGLIDDVTNMVYRTQSEIQRGIGRKPTQQEFSTLVRKHGINKAGLDVLTKINALFDKFLDLSADLAAQEALKITDPVQRAAAVQAVRDNTRNLKSRPYFPFMRYGRHVVLVRNQAGRVIHREHFERRGVYSAAYFQNKAAAQLEKQFPAPQYKVEMDILSESSKPMIGMPGIMLDMMAQKLVLTPQQMKALEQLRFELSPAQSYKHRLQHKSYTKGYSQDFQRSFAQYFFHGAKWYVKTKYASDMKAHIQEIRDSANTQSLTPQKRLEIGNYMDDWLEKGFLNPAQDFISLKAGLVFYTLAYVPMSAAINMSQTPMVTLPYLGAKFGDVGASAALAKAIGTPRNYFRKGGLASMTADAARALDYAIKTGRLEQTLAVELASWAQGSNLGVGYGGTAVARTLHGIVEKGMWMFSIAEKWNRRVAFAAARELALAQPNNKFVREVLPRYQDELKKMLAEGFPQHEAEAILVASHVVDQTQFMTGPDTRPKVMRGKLGTLFLYQRFTQGLLFLTANNKKDFAPRFMLMALAMAGAGGLPFYKDLAEIARVLAYRIYGKDFNLDREIRRLIKGMGGEDWAADQILHGSSRMGFGVPWLLNMLGNAMGQSPTVNQRSGYPSGPDLSGSIGAPAILPVQLGALLGPPVNDPAQMFGQQAARAGGVAGQLAFNFYRAVASKDPADFRRWELVMPRAIRDLSQVYRAYSTGKLAGKNDTAIIRFDTRDPEHLGELIGMTGGFQPRRLTAKYEELREQSESIKWYDVNRGMILDQWVAAIRANDPEEKDRVRLATQEFNAGLPPEARGFALSSDTIQKSIAMRLKSQELMEAGLAAQKNRIPLIRNIQGLNPESAVDVRRIPR